MNTHRGVLLAVSAFALAVDAGLVLGQVDTNDADLNVSITLENAEQARAAVSNLALPIEQESRSSAALPEQERRFEPADFARPNRLESIQIAADDLPRGTTNVAVRCQAIIGTDSALGDYYCVADDNRAAEHAVQAVIDAVPTQRFVAARVDGQTVRVLMDFAVYVDCSSGSCLAVAERNHGYHIEKLGIDYVDPQPILAGDDWYVGFDDKLRWLRTWMPRIGNVDRWYRLYDWLPYIMATEIDASGIAGSGCLHWVGVSWGSRTASDNRNAVSGSNPRPVLSPSGRAMSAPLLPPRTIRDMKSSISSLGRVRFVPGMVDGSPTTLRLYEQALTRFRMDSPEGNLFGVTDIDCN